jgi:HSP20 family molecular chaperone IbpA
LHYRCPYCHYMTDGWMLFNRGCPFCGWVSPLCDQRERASDYRGVYLDVVYEDDLVRITTEMPAADADQIAFDVKGDAVRISARNLDRIVYLRHPVESDVTRTYRNGVLEIVLRGRR